jgi:anti-sigma factor RsiW
MSHLEDLLSALVDGELDGTELDRANAHLAACQGCRAEAAALRRLKGQLRALGEAAGCPALDSVTVRLLALAAPVATGPVAPEPAEASSEPVKARSLRRERGGRPSRMRERPRRRARTAAAAPPGAPSAATAGRRRSRYVIWGALSLVVVGIGSAAFGMGGSGSGSQAPKITPQLVEFDLQHAINAGGVPYAEPTNSTEPTGTPGSPGSPAAPAVKARSKIPVEATTP